MRRTQSSTGSILALLASTTPAKDTKRSASYWQNVAAPLVAATTTHGASKARSRGVAPPLVAAEMTVATAQVSSRLVCGQRASDAGEQAHSTQRTRGEQAHDRTGTQRARRTHFARTRTSEKSKYSALAVPSALSTPNGRDTTRSWSTPYAVMHSSMAAALPSSLLGAAASART